MMNSLVYLTRACPRKCVYCALRDAVDVGRQLTVPEWKHAFDILKVLGVDFNLILGNETWMLGDGLLDLMRHNKVPYALYTTCPEPLFARYKEKFYGSGVIDNLSCGIDYPPFVGEVLDDSYKKSMSALNGFRWVREKFPEVDTHGTITLHRRNYQDLPQLLTLLSNMGVFTAVNFIHWNSDGGFDFFPGKEDILDLLFRRDDFDDLFRVLEEVQSSPGLLQNPQYLEEDVRCMTQMGWHCGGDPYGGPSVDADGRLRVCGYRKGRYTPQFTIFDLPDKLEQWKEAVRMDAAECPGCYWSYPWQYRYWKEHNEGLGTAVFQRHAGRHIPPEKWSKRKQL